MTNETPEDHDRRGPSDRVVGAYREDRDSGRSLDPLEWLANHPDLMPEPTAFLADEVRSRESVATSGPGGAPADSREAPTESGGAMTLPDGIGQAPTRDGPETGVPQSAGFVLAASFGPDPDPDPTVMLPPPEEGATTDLPPRLSGTHHVFGDYALLRVLGHGGMGVVFQACQISLKRSVALKMIRSGRFASESEVQRFRLEAEAVANLDHPHIVPIYEVGQHQGYHYFSMKYHAGGSLEKRIAAYKADPRASARLMVDVARAVHHAHQRGILHRDLKPANILVDADGQPHVTDFGLAKRIEDDDRLTVTGAVMGTPGYMAPEQASGRQQAITTAADVYGLGAVLYALLTGRAPSADDSAPATPEQARRRPPRPPSRANGRVPLDLEVICLACLREDPERRYASAEALADDLQRWLAGEPIVARPVGRAERLYRWARRNPTVAGLTLAMALTLMAIAVAATLAASQFRSLAEDAQARAEETRRLLVRQYVATGVRRLDQGDPLGSLPWFAEALRHDRGGPDRERDHRIRLATVLRACPRLDRIWHHAGGVISANYDAAGRRVVTSGEDGNARVWNVATGEAITPLLRHGDAVRHAAFSPDGRSVLTASIDGTARVWDAATGASLATLEHGGSVRHAAFSPDGRQIVTASVDGEARIWNFATGEVIPVRGHEGPIWHAAFSPDGRHIATAGEDQTARVWDAATGASLATLEHRGAVRHVAFGPGGRRLLSASRDKSARVWDAADDSLTRWTGRRLKHDRTVWHAAFSPDGHFVATASIDGTARVWDAATGTPLTHPLVHDTIALHAAFSPDGRLVVTAGDDKTARVWDVATGALRLTLTHGGPVQRAAFSPDGQHVITASNDGTARAWDIVVETPHLRLVHGSPVRIAVFSPDGRRVLTAGHDGVARLWDAATGVSRAEWKHGAAVWHAAFSPDGRYVVTSTGNAPAEWLAGPVERSRSARGPGEACVWDLRAGKIIARLGHEAIVLHAAFSPDGLRVATAGADKTARVWVAATGRRLATLEHGVAVTHVDFSPDGRFITSAGDDKTALVWDAATGSMMQTPTAMTHSGPLFLARFSPDGRQILTASGSDAAQLWNATTGEPLVQPMSHALGLWDAAFSPDGRRVLTAGDDKTARVWDAATGEPLTPPLMHDDIVMSASFSPDGRRVVSAGADGTARVWELVPDGRPVEDLIRLAGLLSGHRLHPVGGMVPLNPGQFRDEWLALQSRRDRRSSHHDGADRPGAESD